MIIVFCDNGPKEIIGETITCGYYISGANSSFINGFHHCDLTKKQPKIRKIEKRAKNEILRRLKILLSIPPETIDLRKQLEKIVNEEMENLKND